MKANLSKPALAWALARTANAVVARTIQSECPASAFGPSKNIRYTDSIDNALMLNRPNNQFPSSTATAASTMSADTTNASDRRRVGHGRQHQLHAQ